MSSNSNSIQLSQLESRISSVWFRSQMLHLSNGCLALFRWVILLFVGGVAVDWLIDIPAAGRYAFLIALIFWSCYKAWQNGWRKLRGPNRVRTALQLEEQHGGLDSLLVSAIQLRDFSAKSESTGISNSLLEKTCRQAEEAASNLNPTQAVSFRELGPPTLGVVAMAGLIGLFAIFNGPFFNAGLSRIFAPWMLAKYPTYTQLESCSGDLVVKQGAATEIETQISGIAPTKATLLLRTGEGRPRIIDLEIVDGKCTYAVSSTSRDFSYQVKAGDAKSDWYKVTVVPPPRIEKVQVELEYPDYIKRERETLEALTLTIPEGTRIHWNLILDRPIKEANFHRDGEETETLDIGDDGLQIKFNSLASDSRGYHFSWIDKEHGFDFKSSRYFLQVSSDRPPQVELTSPATNLVAMLGRPLQLSTRASDDHGLANAKIIYRVNRREEESVDIRLENGTAEGEQAIDWDYRTAVSDVKVGDTISFGIVVSDRYPGPTGPHRVRSETRRISFLSKEEYLARIEEKKNRLLSHVRSVYRQERAAHEMVRNLSSEDDSFTQSCQLEAIRQEMIRNQINEIARQIQALIDDLAANNVSDAPQSESLDHVQSSLQEIAEKHIAGAAQLLRSQVGSNDGAGPNVLSAARVINTVARELGSLVLLRDIDSAQEVFARELHSFAQIQAALRWDFVANKFDDKEILNEQKEIANWTARLTKDLQAGTRYDKRPLAVLRLTRSVKELGRAHIESSVQKAISSIQSGQTEQASIVQADLVRTFLNAEFSVRLSGAYSTLRQTRDELKLLASVQSKLRNDSSGVFNEKAIREYTQRQSEVRKRLLTLLLPTAPSPRGKLFDLTPPTPPPVEKLLAESDAAMKTALSELQAGTQDATKAAQLQAEQSLNALTKVVETWAVETGLRTQGLATLVAATSERMARIEEFEAQVVSLLDKTDIAIEDKQNVSPIAKTQSVIADELSRFLNDLTEQNQLNPDQDILPLLSLLREATDALKIGNESLQQNEADDAIGHQETAADALAEAFTLVTSQNERLSLLQDLLMFQRAVGFAHGYMADIVAEQKDLLEATENTDASKLKPVFQHLQQCMDDVAPLLDTVAARLDVGTPLAFAKTDFEDAMASLEAGDKLDAIDAQDVAAESLAEVQKLVGEIRTQTGYVAEIVEFLHSATSDAVTFHLRQRELFSKVESAKDNKLEALSAEQENLTENVSRYSEQLTKATGMSTFAKTNEFVDEANTLLKTSDVKASVEKMDLALSELTTNAETLVTVITMLHGLPSIEVNTQTEAALIRLVDVLALASDHKVLMRETHIANSQVMSTLADRQQKLETRCKKIAGIGEGNTLLTGAFEQISKAVKAFEAKDQKVVREAQNKADELLRHFIIEQALILETAVPPAAASDSDPGADGEGSDDESALSAGFISDFVSGEAPKDKRTGWKVLGERNRASLNQNFARELPLEYRGLLKNYYERVAK